MKITIILLAFCIRVNVAPSYLGTNVGWACWRTGCWGRYCGL